MKWMAAVVVLAMAGCGTTRYIEPQPPITSTTISASTQDRVFFVELADYPAFDDVSRSLLIDKAHELCRRLDATGGTSGAKADALAVMLDAGFSMNNALGFMLASVTAYCPQHLAMLR